LETTNAKVGKDRLQACVKHGLKYDPAQHDGCVVCRRGGAAPAPAIAPKDGAAAKGAPAVKNAPPVKSSPPVKGALLLVGLALAAGVGHFGFKAARERVLARQESEAAANEASAGEIAAASTNCRPAAESCFAKCPRASDCANRCLSAFERCLETLEPPLVMGSEGVVVIPGKPGSAPDANAALYRSLWGSVKDLACMNETARTYARLTVDGATGKPFELDAVSSPDPVADCVVRALENAAFPKYSADYDVYAVFKSRK
jgi:hypothetical protein